MATITVLPDDPRTATTLYRAEAGDTHATGLTIGQALDRLLTKLGEPTETTVVIVRPNPAGSQVPPGGRPVTDEEHDLSLDELAISPTPPPLPADFSRADIYSDHD